MTPQDIFDTVARHLFTQGERSARLVLDDDGEPEDTECLYRGPNGMSCAIGALLPDAAYRESMEGQGAVQLCRQWSDVLPAWMPANVDLLEDLQIIHDRAINWKDEATMKFALALLADRTGLDKSILDTLSFNRVEA